MASARTILLAEEDPATAGFLADNLIADGYRVLVADDKTAALELLEEQRPDLVLCDVNGDTLQLIDAVRGCDGLASKIAPDTPLIVLTAHADELARVRYFDRGGDDVIAKPFSYLELRARIGALLRRTYERPHRAAARRGAARSTPPAGRCASARRRSSWPARSSRCCAPRRRADARVHQARAAARRLGLPLRRRARARSTATPAGCAPSSRRAGDRRWIENVWGVGYRLVGVDPDARDGSAA